MLLVLSAMATVMTQIPGLAPGTAVKRVILGVLIAASTVAPLFAQIPQIPPIPSMIDTTQSFDAKDRIFQISGILNSAMPAIKDKMNPRMSVMLDQTLRDGAYDPQFLYPLAADRLSKIHDPKHFNQLSAWYSSPLGYKLTQAELEMSTPEGQAGLEQVSPSQLQAAGVRLALIQQLDQSQGITDFTIDLFNSIIKSSMQSMQSSSPSFGYGGRHRHRYGGDENSSGDRMSLIKLSVQTAAAANLVYECRNFSDDELKQVIAFYRSDTGRWYIRSFHDALKAAFSKTEDKFKRND